MKKISLGEAETMDLVVCNLLVDIQPGDAADRIGLCAQCERLIYWAVPSPDRPPKWCIDCLEAAVGRSGERER